MDVERDVTGGPMIITRGDRMGPDRDRGRPRPNTRRRGPSGDRPRPQPNRSRNDYLTNNMQGPMRILKNPNDRHLVMPGSVSIMQRESSTSGSEAPISPQIHSPENIMLHTSGMNHLSSGNQMLDGGVGGAKKLARRPDGLSSNASSYTPLQPTGRSGRVDRERDSSAFTRVESSGFLTPSNDTITMKLIDKSLNWEARGSENLMDQSDFLVVGVLGKQGVGKSTVMSLLAGTRTGSGRPYMFRTQPKETQESGSYLTSGVDMVVTSERVILLDTQPILSDAILEQHMSDGMIPNGVTPDSYSDVVSLQLAIFLFAVCHVVVVVMESGDLEVVLRFLWIAEKLKSTCKTPTDGPQEIGDDPATEYFPQIVFVLNHATPDDFQPAALKELHSLLAENFNGTRVSVTGGVSLARSGLVPVGKLIPPGQKDFIVGGASGKSSGVIEDCNINLHLLPTNTNPQDNFGAHCVERHDREDAGLNPILSLIPMYQGHPSFQLLAETFRNQIFMMPRPTLSQTRNSSTSQPMFERDWYEHAHRTWTTVKKSNLISEHKKLLRDMQQS